MYLYQKSDSDRVISKLTPVQKRLCNNNSDKLDGIIHYFVISMVLDFFDA